MRNIFWGLLIIAIGLAWGDSVFRGQFSIRSILFDAVGVIVIVSGVVSIYRAKRETEH
jgi:hypothetical protein